MLIPSFDTGRLLAPTVQGARAAWAPVWVVIDGSTDGSERDVAAMAAQDPGLRVLRRARRGGKGSALRLGLTEAWAAGFTHALVMDADGQHPADLIPAFMQASRAEPGAMVLGTPVFGPEAPALRVQGRRVSNWWARLETGGRVADSLFGFRVYPIAALLGIMERSAFMRGYDFDVEAAVRLCWAGVSAINRPAPVRYPSRAEGGVSHFRYWRDNLRLTTMHVRLMAALLSGGARRARSLSGGARRAQSR